MVEASWSGWGGVEWSGVEWGVTVRVFSLCILLNYSQDHHCGQSGFSFFLLSAWCRCNFPKLAKESVCVCESHVAKPCCSSDLHADLKSYPKVSSFNREQSESQQLNGVFFFF